MSNEIIRRCCREINLEKIFDGYVQTGMKSLNDCIECCEQWKDIYRKVGVIVLRETDELVIGLTLSCTVSVIRSCINNNLKKYY